MWIRDRSSPACAIAIVFTVSDSWEARGATISSMALADDDDGLTAERLALVFAAVPPEVAGSEPASSAGRGGANDSDQQPDKPSAKSKSGQGAGTLPPQSRIIVPRRFVVPVRRHRFMRTSRQIYLDNK
jgi:hypothetical protein